MVECELVDNLLLFSCSIVSDFLWPYEMQHTRLPCPSLSPGVSSNSCPLSPWCPPTVSFSVVPFFSLLQSFLASGSFPMNRLFRIRWPKYWSFSFSISPSKEYSGPISFRMDWLDLLAVQGTLKSLLQHHSSKTLILRHLSHFYGPTLPSVHDYWKNHSFHCTGLCQQSNVSAF